MPIVSNPQSPYFWYDFYYRGRRYRGSTKERSKSAAREIEAALLMQLKQGDPLPMRGRDAPTVRSLLDHFLTVFDSNQLRSDATKRYYRCGAKLLLAKPLADLRLDQVTTSVAAATVLPRSAYTKNQVLRTLRRLMSYAVELGHLRFPPKIHLYREIPRDTIFTPDYEARLLAVAPQLLADIFVLLMDTGTRPAEIYRLKWEDVLWSENLLRIREGKTAASRRTIGMSTRVRQILQRRHQGVARSQWVFPARAGGHVYSVAKAFAQARKEAGLPQELVLYATRHTFGTDLMEDSADLKLTMAVMGHVDVRSSARYQHPSTTRVGEMMDRRNARRQIESGSGSV
jgi:integrase